MINDFRELRIGNLAAYQANINKIPDSEPDVSYIRDDTLHLSFDLLEVRIKQDNLVLDKIDSPKNQGIELKKPLTTIGDGNIRKKAIKAENSKNKLESEETPIIPKRELRSSNTSVPNHQIKLKEKLSPKASRLQKALSDTINKNKLADIIDQSEIESLFELSGTKNSEEESKMNERILEILTSKIMTEREYRKHTEKQIERLVQQNKKQIDALEKLLKFKRPTVG